jgi:hypothetical protein
MAPEEDKKDPHSIERITGCVFDNWSAAPSAVFRNDGNTR